jgi:hypothetical protein
MQKEDVVSPSPPESEAKNGVSPESGCSSDGMGYVFDELADVDLGIDSSGWVPGFIAAEQDMHGKTVEASVLELSDDFLDFDSNLNLDEYSLS